MTTTGRKVEATYPSVLRALTVEQIENLIRASCRMWKLYEKERLTKLRLSVEMRIKHYLEELQERGLQIIRYLHEIAGRGIRIALVAQ